MNGGVGEDLQPSFESDHGQMDIPPVAVEHLLEMEIRGQVNESPDRQSDRQATILYHRDWVPEVILWETNRKAQATQEQKTGRENDRQRDSDAHAHRSAHSIKRDLDLAVVSLEGVGHGERDSHGLLLDLWQIARREEGDEYKDDGDHEWDDGPQIDRDLDHHLGAMESQRVEGDGKKGVL